MSPTYIILVDGATPELRDEIHQRVKEAANGWWHHFSDAWIVGGKNVTFWRDLVGDVITGTGASVLVLALPKQGRNWSFFGPNPEKKKTNWLRRNYRDS